MKLSVKEILDRAYRERNSEKYDMEAAIVEKNEEMQALGRELSSLEGQIELIEFLRTEIGV